MSRIRRYDAMIDVLVEIITLQDYVIRNKQKRKPTRKWIERRSMLGASSTLLRELAEEDPSSYFNFLRINEDMFNALHAKIANVIQKENTNMRAAIPSKVKLHIALRFLATGDSLASLQYLFRIPKCTISSFLPEVFDAIYNELQDFMQVPNTEEEWKKISDGFASRWNFPRCIGAIDGKHINIQCPPCSGSAYYNYKGAFSIVLLALVDHDYNFIGVDIGSYGSASDGGIFAKSQLCFAIEGDKLNIPKGSVILGDDAFPLKNYLMKPYPKRRAIAISEKIYNYRHCRARRIVENAFGILSSRFRIFRTSISLSTPTVLKLVRTACVLHNWIRKTGDARKCQGNVITVDIEDTERGVVISGSWRYDPAPLGLQQFAPAAQHNGGPTAEGIRAEYARYFLNEGAVPWQMKFIEL